jgi:hypothetical protein
MDTLIQNNVRLENLKEGEARKIVRFLVDLQEDLKAKISNASTNWSRERYESLYSQYSEALDAVYDGKVLPSLKQDGIEFVAKSVERNEDALITGITGKSKAERVVAAIDDGFDTSVVMYRGSTNVETTSGRWFTSSKEYAGAYARNNFSRAPTADEIDDLISKGFLQKYYLPKDNIIDFTKDKEIFEKAREKFMKTYGYLKGPDGQYDVSPQVQKMMDDLFSNFFGPNGHPASNAEDFFLELLDKERPNWKGVKFYEAGMDNFKGADTSIHLRKDGLAKSVNADFTNTAPKAIKKVAKNKLGNPLINSTLSPEAIYAAANVEPMQGKLLVQWASGLKAKEKRLISAALRQSWIEGESVDKAAKRLEPIFSASRRDLKAITRTYYGHLAAKTRDQVWENNSDIVEGIYWDSILDGRTTTDICGPRDQLKYTLSGEPIGHSMPYLSGPGQAHWNCRSMSMPIIKGIEPAIRRPAVGAGKNYERGDRTTRTGRVRTNSADNRRRGIFKDTTVSHNTDYEKWLKKQPVAFQQDVLGVAKAKAFRSGEWSLGEKFSPENPITIEDY